VWHWSQFDTQLVYHLMFGLVPASCRRIHSHSKKLSRKMYFVNLTETMRDMRFIQVCLLRSRPPKNFLEDDEMTLSPLSKVNKARERKEVGNDQQDRFCAHETTEGHATFRNTRECPCTTSEQV